MYPPELIARGNFRMLDLWITDGWVVDGTGNPWYRADVGIEGGTIAWIGPHQEWEARREISAKDRVVSPGFIDMHSHADWWLLAQPLHEPKVQQGITTELIGQDGFSLAPLSSERSSMLRPLIAGMHGDPNLPWSWNSLSEYLDVLQSSRPSVNAACLVGHGTLRVGAMGVENRPASERELDSMKALLERSLQQGAAGLSTGLIYAPCYYAPTEELLELCRVVARRQGILVVHMRSEGDRLVESIDEMLSIAERSGVSLHISHFKVFGRANWGRSVVALERVEEARLRGIDVTFDQYPYIAGSTGLGAILPPWANEGGPTYILQRLCDPGQRARIREQIEGDSSWENLMKGAGADKIYVAWARSSRNQWMEGRSIADLAASQGLDATEFALQLLVEEELAVSMVNFSLSEEDVRRILIHPLHMVSTDSILLGRPHPRAYGTYPRILGHYVREERLLTIEQAIRKMTSFPAQRLRLRDRGVLRNGAWADIVIFDPKTINDRATFENPNQYPTGIEHVLVNGVPTVSHGRHLHARAGQALRLV